MAVMRRRRVGIEGPTHGRKTGLIWRDDAGDTNGIRESTTDPGDPPFEVLGNALNAAGDLTARRTGDVGTNTKLGTPTP